MSKHIALISEHASPLAPLGGVDAGGQNVYVGEIAKHLVELGYRVDVFTRRDSDRLPEVAEWMNGGQIVHVPAGPPRSLPKEELLPHMAAFTSYMESFIRSRSRPYDLVHANFFMSGLVATEIKRRLGIPFVVTFHALGKVRRLHQGGADGFPDERFDIEQRIVDEADAVIAECPQDEEDLIRYYNADTGRLLIVPAGFDPADFWPIGKALARIALGFDPDERILLQLGRIVPRKGVDDAIRGAARLAHQYGLPSRLLIVGGDQEDPQQSPNPELERLRQVAREEDAVDLVTFVGGRGREALRWYYSAADLFISTPWYEPFGITPVEAMACGAPVIGSNVGGIKFTVRDGETGYLVSPRDPDAIAERMAHLYNHPKLLETFRSQAIRRARDLFDWNKVTRDLSVVYEDVVARCNPDGYRPNESTLLDESIDAAIQGLQDARLRLRGRIIEGARVIVAAFEDGGSLLVCGNGGSAADSQHFVAELVGRFEQEGRRALPALALTADGATLTAWANDCDFDRVFSRQVEAHGKPGDVLLTLSTSGNSPNVIRSLQEAKRRGLTTVGLLGRNGGEALQWCDVAIVVPGSSTAVIQEVHTVLLHVLCRLVEHTERNFGVETISNPTAENETATHASDRRAG